MYLALSLSQLFKGNVRAAAAATREGRPTLKAAGRPTCLPAARKEGGRERLEPMRGGQQGAGQSVHPSVWRTAPLRYKSGSAL